MRRYESSSIVLKEREGILTQFRGAEQKFRTELTMEKNITTSLQTKNRECEQDLAGALQKKETAELNSEATAKRNTDLYDRCKQMAGKLESERKTRMVAQREARIAKDVAKGSGVAPADGVTSSSSISDQDQAMLSLTLDMLRCSVCKDRFKEVAITRCYHMFCRECIDINLANRHRKCPACGEKFGYDDVKTVYFNH
jgi:E3 ubiquitin-protein ligase BRE1